MERLTPRGLCVSVTSCLLLLSALSALAVGLKSCLLGAALKERFQVGSTAGAFCSGAFTCAGCLAVGASALSSRRARGESALLLGVLLFMLGTLTALAGALIDGDTIATVERKYSRHCLREPRGPRQQQPRLEASEQPDCQKLRDYERILLVSAVLNALECVLGFITLTLIRQYKSWQPPRQQRHQQHHQQQHQQQRRSAGSILSTEEQLFPMHTYPGPPFPPSAANAAASSSYINFGADEAGGERGCSGHPSRELPGYSLPGPDTPRLCLYPPRGHPPPAQRPPPPPYEHLFPRASGL
ncbi:transmembrane protein 271-like [Callorhinchus milii]|uniref:transmembrane protein 271-like n=1 Tax=Callorhinchus milii TaxID=7868 RepID=UPI001C3F589E|nr:transmembrane protein 271-like [Callorhinchus milii]